MAQYVEIEDDLKRLDEHLTRRGLVRKGMPKDGACMFRCVSEVLHGTQMNHANVRKACVLFMEQNADEFSPFVDTEECDSYEGYLQRMLDETAWGSQIELQALSRRFELDFDIYTDDQSCSLLTVHNGGRNKKVILAYSSGNHYDLVYPKDEFEALTIAQCMMTLILEASNQLINNNSNRPVLLGTVPKQYKYDNMGLRLWKSDVNKQNKKDRKMARKLQDFSDPADSSANPVASPAPASPAPAPAPAPSPSPAPVEETSIPSTLANETTLAPSNSKQPTPEEDAELRRSLDQLEQEKNDAALAQLLQEEEDANALAEEQAEEDESPEPQQAQGKRKKQKAGKKKAQQQQQQQQQQNQQKQKQQQPHRTAESPKTDSKAANGGAQQQQQPFRGADGSSSGERAVESSASPETQAAASPKKGAGFRYKPKEEPIQPSSADNGLVTAPVSPSEPSPQPVAAEDVQEQPAPVKVKPSKQPIPAPAPFILPDARQAFLAANPSPPEVSGGVIYPRPMEYPLHNALPPHVPRPQHYGRSPHLFPAVQSSQAAEYYGRMYMALAQQQIQAAQRLAQYQAQLRQAQPPPPMFAHSPNFDSALQKPSQTSPQEHPVPLYPANPCFYS